MTTSGRRRPRPKRSRGRRQKWPAEQIEQLGRRFEDGETSAEIAKSIGATKSAIASLLWRRGYVREER